MTKQRIRRRGADGHDAIFDVDLGPDSVTTTSPMGAAKMGDMQPILTQGGSQLKDLDGGGSWRVVRRFVITGPEHRSRPRWHRRAGESS